MSLVVVLKGYTRTSVEDRSGKRGHTYEQVSWMGVVKGYIMNKCCGRDGKGLHYR